MLPAVIPLTTGSAGNPKVNVLPDLVTSISFVVPVKFIVSLIKIFCEGRPEASALTAKSFDVLFELPTTSV